MTVGSYSEAEPLESLKLVEKKIFTEVVTKKSERLESQRPMSLKRKENKGIEKRCAEIVSCRWAIKSHRTMKKMF